MREPAINQLESAALQGDAHARNRLALAYWLGDGMPTNLEQAESWLKLGAERGNATDQYNLGCFYHSALGSPLDSIEVVYWWRQAAKQGYMPNSTKLAYNYQTLYAAEYQKMIRATAPRS